MIRADEDTVRYRKPAADAVAHAKTMTDIRVPLREGDVIAEMSLDVDAVYTAAKAVTGDAAQAARIALMFKRLVSG